MSQSSLPQASLANIASSPLVSGFDRTSSNSIDSHKAQSKTASHQSDQSEAGKMIPPLALCPSYREPALTTPTKKQQAHTVTPWCALPPNQSKEHAIISRWSPDAKRGLHLFCRRCSCCSALLSTTLSLRISRLRSRYRRLYSSAGSSYRCTSENLGQLYS